MAILGLFFIKKYTKNQFFIVFQGIFYVITCCKSHTLTKSMKKMA